MRRVYAEVAASMAECELSSTTENIPLLTLQQLHYFRDSRLISQLLTEVQIAVWKRIDAPNFYYRGTTVDRLPLVARLGIDIEPTDRLTFADNSAEKCLEYGPVVLVLDPAGLRRSWRELAADASAEEVTEAEAEFGSNFLLAEDGSRWYTRGDLDDPMVARPGECAYGWYIPGDPWEVLCAVWRFGDDEQE
jgi:hypothetical protein